MLTYIQKYIHTYTTFLSVKKPTATPPPLRRGKKQTNQPHGSLIHNFLPFELPLIANQIMLCNSNILFVLIVVCSTIKSSQNRPQRVFPSNMSSFSLCFVFFFFSSHIAMLMMRMLTLVRMRIRTLTRIADAGALFMLMTMKHVMFCFLFLPPCSAPFSTSCHSPTCVNPTISGSFITVFLINCVRITLLLIHQRSPLKPSLGRPRRVPLMRPQLPPQVHSRVRLRRRRSFSKLPPETLVVLGRQRTAVLVLWLSEHAATTHVLQIGRGSHVALSLLQSCLLLLRLVVVQFGGAHLPVTHLPLHNLPIAQLLMGDLHLSFAVPRHDVSFALELLHIIMMWMCRDRRVAS